jgi:sulfoxide reductase heme-binding subunit YedZ
MAARNKTILLLKTLCWAGCLLPLVLIVMRTVGVNGLSLGPNPVEAVLHGMGRTGLNILLITLAVTPVRVLTGFNALARLRRPLGLFSFFYVILHFLTYALLDLRLAWSTIFVDITAQCVVDFATAVKLGIPDDCGNIARWHKLVSARPSAAA